MNSKEVINRVINDQADMPFEYGTCDCLTFTNEISGLYSGRSHAVYFEGRYTDRKSAYKFLKELGGVVEAAKSALGTPLKSASMCVDGDVVVGAINEQGDLAFGVVVNGHALFKSAPAGVLRMPLHLCVEGWRVY
jgi:hypothetical protein